MQGRLQEAHIPEGARRSSRGRHCRCTSTLLCAASCSLGCRCMTQSNLACRGARLAGHCWLGLWTDTTSACSSFSAAVWLLPGPCLVRSPRSRLFSSRITCLAASRIARLCPAVFHGSRHAPIRPPTHGAPSGECSAPISQTRRSRQHRGGSSQQHAASRPPVCASRLPIPQCGLARAHRFMGKGLEPMHEDARTVPRLQQPSAFRGSRRADEKKTAEWAEEWKNVAKKSARELHALHGQQPDPLSRPSWAAPSVFSCLFLPAQCRCRGVLAS